MMSWAHVSSTWGSSPHSWRPSWHASCLALAPSAEQRPAAAQQRQRLQQRAPAQSPERELRSRGQQRATSAPRRAPGGLPRPYLWERRGPVTPPDQVQVTTASGSCDEELVSSESEQEVGHESERKRPEVPEGCPPQPALDLGSLQEWAQHPLKRQRALVRGALPTGFYTSVDHDTGRRTLHCLGCYRTPYIDYKQWLFLGSSAPLESLYDRACRTCFSDVPPAPQVAEPSAPGEELASDEDFTSEESELEGYADSLGSGADGLEQWC